MHADQTGADDDEDDDEMKRNPSSEEFATHAMHTHTLTC